MSAQPRRIQRQRTKGWRMPEGAVYVGRPTQWGNPWKVGTMTFTRHGSPWGGLPLRPMTREEVVECYGRCVHQFVVPDGRYLVDAARDELRGRDLVCWCALDQPCHADVLLRVANRVPKRTRSRAAS